MKPPGKLGKSMVPEGAVSKSWYIGEDSLISSNINLSPSYWRPEILIPTDLGKPKVLIDELVYELREQIECLQKIKDKLA